MPRSFTRRAGSPCWSLVGTALVGCTRTGAVQVCNAASDVGITAKTIRVAVIADVDNPIVPNVLQGIVDGVKGWGKYVNANGGIAGRKVQVDFIDSKLNPNDARNAMIKACSRTSPWSAPARCSCRRPLTSSCPDSTGKATGIPDIAALVTNIAAGVPPTGPDRAELGRVQHGRQEPPQTYRANNGDSKYLVKQNGTCTVRSCSPATRRRWEDVEGPQQGWQAAGIKADHSWQVTGASPQSVYTPIIPA